MLQIIREQPMLRTAIFVPSVVALIFVLLNLTAAVDQGRAFGALVVGIANLDTGAQGPGGEVRLGEQSLGGMAGALPFATQTFADEATAREALDNGEIAAAIVLPADFSQSVLGGGTVNAAVLRSDHLSAVEVQFGRVLQGQIQGALALAVVGVRSAMAGAPAAGAPAAGAPPVLVTANTLHAVTDARLLQAPFVLSFAAWMAGLIGSIMLFIGSRGILNAGAARDVAALRTAIPVVAALGSSLIAILMVGLVTGRWEGFLELWAFQWLVVGTAMMTLSAILSVLGFAGILVAVPLVFYQGAVSGNLAPSGAAPDWIVWLGDILPLEQMAMGVRTLLIGGPEGSVPWGPAALVLAGAVVAIWVGTYGYAMRKPAAEAGEGPP